MRAIITGFDEAEGLFNEIPKELKRRVLRRAMKSASAPIVLRAKQNAGRSSNKDSGLLQDSIGVSIKTKRSGVAQANIRPMGRAVVVIRRKKNGQTYQVRTRAANYLHHLEFGNKNMPPEPIMRPALESGASESLLGFKSEVENEIDKITARAARKSEKARANMKSSQNAP